jgi:hypothetical protein
LVAGFSSRRPGLKLRVVHVVDKVEDVQMFSDCLRFKLSVFIITIQTLIEPRNFRMEQQLKKRGKIEKNNIFDKRGEERAMR